MKSFLEYITEESAGKNTHMTHLEDAIIYKGVDGARDAINALRAMRDMLEGHAKKNHKATIKWDGAPAVFAGIDPSDGQFFVSKKGIDNKEPKVYKSIEDIKKDTSGDLQKKFIVAFNELKNLGIKNIIQGDLMFTKGDLENQTIDGKKYITFQPNTILYAVPADSDAAKEIKRANIGVVWHTSYSGPNFQGLTASFDVDISSMKKNPKVWQLDANLQDLSGTASMTAEETDRVNEALSRAGKIFSKISGNVLRDISRNSEFSRELETFNNTLVRRGQKITNTSKHVDDLIRWSKAKFDDKIASLKSEKGRETWKKKKADYLKFFSVSNKKNLALMYDLQNAIVDAKNMIIVALDRLKKIDTFVRTKNGFKVTKQEGFVAVDELTNQAYKLVDRLEFSTNNFSPEIIKGWEK